MSLIRRYDRDALREQFRNASPFPFFVVDGFLEDGFASEAAASYPSFEAAARSGRVFGAVNEMGKVQICDSAAFPEPLRHLVDAIRAPAFLRDLEYVTGIPRLLWDPSLHGAGMQETRSGGWLDAHVDFNVLEQPALFRRLNILIYLNPGWDEGWGGEIELWNRDVSRRCQALAPIHNRCVVFATSDTSYHGVAAVRCPKGVVRKSFAAYYYTRESPPGWDGSRHSTIFKARPDEHLKRYLWMPAERAQRALRQRLGRLRRALRRLRDRG